MPYTKGDWKHTGDGVIIADDGRQICAVFPRDREANVHLIVAAPEMYEALKEAQIYTKQNDRVHFKVEQALAKVEGK